MMTALATLGIASVISTNSASTIPFILGCALSGVAMPGIRDGCARISETVIPPRKRRTVTGLLALSYGLGTLAALLFGGALPDASALGWRWCCYSV